MPQPPVILKIKAAIEDYMFDHEGFYCSVCGDPLVLYSREIDTDTLEFKAFYDPCAGCKNEAAETAQAEVI